MGSFSRARNHQKESNINVSNEKHHKGNEETLWWAHQYACYS